MPQVSTGEVVVRQFEEKDTAAAAALLVAAFGRWPNLPVAVSAEEHLRWKIFGSPGAPFPSVVAVEGERVVGTGFRHYDAARVAGEAMECMAGNDSAMHPDYQGQGVYSRLRKLRDEVNQGRARFQIGHSGSSVIATRMDDWNWIPLGHPVALLRWPGRPGLAGRPGERLRRTPRLPAGLTLATATAFDARVDALYERAAPQFELIIDRTAARLNWRYCDPRGGTFAVRFAAEGETLAGYSVLRPAGRVGFLADLLVLPGREDVARALAFDAVAQLRRGGARVIRVWLPERHPYQASLRAAGFAVAGRRLNVRYRSWPGGEQAAALLGRRDARLHYMLGDTDLV
jgi:hypothetical protein